MKKDNKDNKYYKLNKNDVIKLMANEDRYLDALTSGQLNSYYHDKTPVIHIYDLISWLQELTIYRLGSDIYGKDRTATDNDGYVIGKFNQINNNFIGWLCSLDYKGRIRLAHAIRKMNK